MRVYLLMASLLSAAVLACSQADDGSRATLTKDEAQSGVAFDARGPGAGGFAGEVAAKQEAMSAAAPGRAPLPPMAAPAFEPSAIQLPGTSQSVVPSMVIRTGVAQILVDSLEIAVQQLRQLVQGLGGYIANTNMQGGEGQMRQATLELKIPADRFDQAVSGLGGLGKVEGVNVNAQEVGEEFVDITARVKNAKRLEDRLLVLLASRTGKLEEVLQVEQQLARVREEIERYEGRLRFLHTRAALSTLAVMVHEKAPIMGGPGGGIIDAFRDAWRNFVDLIEGFIRSLGVLIPLAGLVALTWLGLRRWWPPRNTRPPRGE